jgi:hypothetical protein
MLQVEAKNVQIKLARNVVAPEGSDGQIVWVTKTRAMQLFDLGAASLFGKMPKEVQEIAPQETKPIESFEKKSLPATETGQLTDLAASTDAGTNQPLSSSAADQVSPKPKSKPQPKRTNTKKSRS